MRADHLINNKTMNKFISNINEYLKSKGIKNSYVSLITGWDKSKVSRILSGEVDIKMDDADLLARALGKETGFFLRDEDVISDINTPQQFAFYAGHLEQKDKIVAKRLQEMFRFYDSLTDLEV